MPSSSGSPQPRDRTHVSCIAGRFLTIWATREAFYWKKKILEQLKLKFHDKSTFVGMALQLWTIRLPYISSIYFSGFILISVLGSSTHWLPPVNFSLSHCRALAYTILLPKMFCVSPFLELFFSSLFPSDTRVAASSPSWVYWRGNIGQGEKWSLPITYSSVRYWVGQKVHLGFSRYWKL